jgi:hypothetical protein
MFSNLAYRIQIHKGRVAVDVALPFILNIHLLFTLCLGCLPSRFYHWFSVCALWHHQHDHGRDWW